MSWYHAALTPDGCPGTTRLPDPTDPSPVARFRPHPGPQLVKSSDGGGRGAECNPSLTPSLHVAGRDASKEAKGDRDGAPPRDACTRTRDANAYRTTRITFSPTKKEKVVLGQKRTPPPGGAGKSVPWPFEK